MGVGVTIPADLVLFIRSAVCFCFLRFPVVFGPGAAADRNSDGLEIARFVALALGGRNDSFAAGDIVCRSIA